MHINRYDTLAEAIDSLKKEGYTVNFRIIENGIMIDNEKREFKPADVKLEEYHRFEGISNPDDSSILYAVETNSGLKGLVVDSYGATGSEAISEFMNRVKQEQFKK